MPNIEYANAGCLIENIMLTATSLGLGSVYIYGNLLALSNRTDILQKLQLPEGYKLVSAVAIGYDAMPDAPRYPKEKISIHYL